MPRCEPGGVLVKWLILHYKYQGPRGRLCFVALDLHMCLRMPTHFAIMRGAFSSCTASTWHHLYSLRPCWLFLQTTLVCLPSQGLVCNGQDCMTGNLTLSALRGTKICYISVVVIGQPQQQRQGQQNTTITTSMMALKHLQGRQMTSEQQPMLVEKGDRATAVCEFA